MQPTISIKLAFYSILTVLAVLLLSAAIYINNSLLERHHNQVFSETQQQLSLYHNRLFTNLQNHIQIVRGLPSIFAINPDLSQAQFARAVRHLVSPDSEIRNIAAAPDMVIQYMYPIAGNEAAMGLDYRKEPAQFEAADRARRTRELVLAGPLELKQGGVGLITRIPVFLEDKVTGEEYYWGLISAVINFERFLEKSGLLDESFPIKLAIQGKDSLGRLGEAFFGDPALFDSPELTQTLKLPEGEWLLAAEPIGGWSVEPQDIWQQRVLVFGAAAFLFLLLALFIRFIFAAALADHRFKHLLESSPVPYLLLNGSREVSFINRAFTDTYGYRLNEIKSLDSWWQVTADPERYSAEFKAYLTHLGLAGREKLSSTPIELELTTLSGQRKVALVSTSVMQDAFDDEMLLVVYDITVRKEAEEQLRFSSRVFNQAQEGIIITDIAGKITDVNPAFCEITGYNREEVLGKGPEILNSGKHSPEFFSAMWQSILEHGYWQGEVWNRRKNGELYAELLTISALTDDDGQSRHYVGLFSDITQTKQQQETLELMAHYDVLTKLPNRILFADRFSQALGHSKRTETMLAICFLDLDNFKPVNDNYGHEVGDQLLIEVAMRLQNNVRDEDTISRFGGDEFAILFRDIESQKECEFMLRRIHESLAQPYIVNDLKIEISASSGVTFYPQENADLDTLLRHADQTMYQAKLAGRNTYKSFNPAQNRETIQKQQWLQQIRDGLEQNEFRLFYQPKVNMRTGEVFGMEALIRWLHPNRGLLSPIHFLPMIEGTELETQIGKWVLASALQQLENWHAQGFEVEVSVNVASAHLQSPHFIDDVEAALAKHPETDSKYLQLEIVETSSLGDVGAISKMIKLCRDLMGVSIALDDFGTGYSSLTHLRHLAASTIKIDQTFVRDMLDDPQDYTIVDGVSGLAEAFNRQVIAEGVETVEHGLMLLLSGCDRAQGYGIAKPMPAEEVLDWVNDYQPNPEWLAFAAESMTVRQQALKLFDLTSQHWNQIFVANLAKEPDQVQHWPIMDHRKCHCGSWIHRVRVQGIFDEAWLNKLENAHNQWHSLAYELRENYLSQAPAKARQQIDDLQRLYTTMDALLDSATQPLSALAKRTIQPENNLH